MEIKTHLTNKKILIEFTEENGAIIQKRCIKCSVMLPLTNFPDLKGSFLNKNNHCKGCESLRHQNLRRNKGIATKQPQVITHKNGTFSRECSKCKHIKIIDDYDLNPSGYLGHDSECKECKRRRGELYRRNKGIRPQRTVPIIKNKQNIVTHRECARCLRMQELSQFNKHGGGTAYLGIHPYCKTCSADRYLIENYGITLKDKIQMFENQNKSCAICDNQFPFEKIKVDHCHKTEKIRGLLCDDCNLCLGKLKENTTTLENMIKYINNSAKE